MDNFDLEYGNSFSLVYSYDEDHGNILKRSEHSRNFSYFPSVTHCELLGIYIMITIHSLKKVCNILVFSIFLNLPGNKHIIYFNYIFHTFRVIERVD